MFRDTGLVVSLPAAAIAGRALPGSLFDPASLANAHLPAELDLALELVLDEARLRDVPVRMVARPEIFTHGATLGWLRRKLGEVQDHLCISDGRVIRMIPGLATHAFFYQTDCIGAAHGLATLARRAPELLASLHTQVNTAFDFPRKGGTGWPNPPTLVLRRRTLAPATTPRLLPLHLKAESADHSAALMLQQPGLPAQAVLGRPVLVVALSGLAWSRSAVADAMAERILATSLNRRQFLIILVPPDSRLRRENAVQGSIAAILAALAGSKTRLPRVPVGNVGFVVGDGRCILPADHPVSLLVDRGFCAWRHDRPFYDRMEALTLLDMDGAPPALLAASARLLAEFTGRPPRCITIGDLASGCH